MSLSSVYLTSFKQFGDQCQQSVREFPVAHPHVYRAMHYGLCTASAVYFGQSLLGRLALFGATHVALRLSEKTLSLFSSTLQTEKLSYHNVKNTDHKREQSFFNTEIVLTKTELDATHLERLVTTNPCLRSLSIQECRLTDKAVEVIATLISTSRLTHLSLGYITFSDSQLALLTKALFLNHSLEECHLSYCIPNDESLILVIQSLASHKSIHTLSLESNAVLAPGMLALAHLIRTNKKIEKLKLIYQLFQDLGSEHIAASLNENQTLKSLDLSGNAMKQEPYNLFLKKAIERPSLKLSLPSTSSSFSFF